MNKHTDIFGNVLEIGDMVATTQWGNSKTRKELEIAIVVGFTEQKVRVEYIGITEYDYKQMEQVNKITTKYSNQLSKRCDVNAVSKLKNAIIEYGKFSEDSELLDRIECFIEE